MSPALLVRQMIFVQHDWFVQSGRGRGTNLELLSVDVLLVVVAMWYTFPSNSSDVDELEVEEKVDSFASLASVAAALAGN